VYLVLESKSNKKEDLEQIRNAEKKYQALIDKRNELNTLAKLSRDERDMLNTKRKELRDQLDACKTERDSLVKQMKEHKTKRTAYQQQAKDLISAKRKKKGDVVKNLPLQAEELKADIQLMEYEQETTPMDTRAENKLIDKIKIKRREFDTIKVQMEKQHLIETDLSDVDKAITELFKKADEEHQQVVHFYEASQKKHEEFLKTVNEISTLISESNKKHKQYLEQREEAQDSHNKAIEMRSKIIGVKKERMMLFQEARDTLRNQNLLAKKALNDEGKLDQVAENSVNALKNGKKISLT
jgi:uncharacterized coiled-coil DUF342 family protein